MIIGSLAAGIDSSSPFLVRRVFTARNRKKRIDACLRRRNVVVYIINEDIGRHGGGLCGLVEGLQEYDDASLILFLFPLPCLLFVGWQTSQTISCTDHDLLIISFVRCTSIDSSHTSDGPCTTRQGMAIM